MLKLYYQQQQQQQQLDLLEHAYELEEEKYLPAIGNS